EIHQVNARILVFALLGREDAYLVEVIRQVHTFGELAHIFRIARGAVDSEQSALFSETEDPEPARIPGRIVRGQRIIPTNLSEFLGVYARAAARGQNAGRFKQHRSRARASTLELSNGVLTCAHTFELLGHVLVIRDGT